LSNLSLIPAIAGISMSFAGFAGLLLAVRPKDSPWQRSEIGQINAIVGYALTALFSALFVVPLASVLDVATAIRFTSAAALVIGFYQHQIRVGTAWSRWHKIERLSRRQWVLEGGAFMVLAIVEQLLLLANVVQPSQELYELALATMLGTPALIFLVVISQVGVPRID
jgi:hypothetical protein